MDRHPISDSAQAEYIALNLNACAGTAHALPYQRLDSDLQSMTGI
jgi:hypothetical protein